MKSKRESAFELASVLPTVAYQERSGGFEPLTDGLEIRCSNFAADGTLVSTAVQNFLTLPNAVAMTPRSCPLREKKEVTALGLEPRTYGLKERGPESGSNSTEMSYGNHAGSVVPKVVPAAAEYLCKRLRANEQSDPLLVRLLARWQGLPENIKLSLIALVEASNSAGMLSGPPNRPRAPFIPNQDSSNVEVMDSMTSKKDVDHTT